MRSIMLILLFICLISHAQDYSDIGLNKKELQQIAIIEQENCVHAKSTGIIGGISEVYGAFQLLHASTTTEEMLSIYQVSDSAMKIYAYWSLIEKNRIIADSLYPELIEFNTETCYMSGDVMLMSKDKDICASIITLYHPKANGEQWFEIGKYIKPKKIRKRKKF